MIPLGMGGDGKRGQGRRPGHTSPRSGRGQATQGVAARRCRAGSGRGHAAGRGLLQRRPAAAAAPASHAAPAVPTISPAQRKMAARSYLAIALPANRRLDEDFDGLDDNHNDLAAAEAALRDAAATERQFDRRLLVLKLPAATETVARLLVTANEARARLTTAAAASTSLSQFHRDAPAHRGQPAGGGGGPRDPQPAGPAGPETS